MAECRAWLSDAILAVLIGCVAAVTIILSGFAGERARGARRALCGSDHPPSSAPRSARQFAMYYINLDESADRREAIEAAFSDHGMEVERLAASRGREVLRDDHASPLLWHMGEHFRQHPERIGHLGCMHSHIRVYERFLRTRRPYCMVFEDDCEFLVDRFWNRFLEAAQTAPVDWDVLLLGYYLDDEFHPSHAKDNASSKLERGWLSVYRFTGLHCYVINRRAARRLLDALASPRWYLDWSMSDLLCRGDFRAYGAFPPLATQPASPRIKLRDLHVDTRSTLPFRSMTNDQDVGDGRAMVGTSSTGGGRRPPCPERQTRDK